MYKHEGNFANIPKYMLSSFVPKVKNKLHIISYFENAPIHGIEIQKLSLATTQGPLGSCLGIGIVIGIIYKKLVWVLIGLWSRYQYNNKRLVDICQEWILH